MNKTYCLITFIFLAILFTQNAYSAEGKDNRARILKAFLQKHSSPLADSAHDFVKNADMYNLDWKLVAAISGVESTFGKFIPYNSYNGWGWGIYGNNVIRFYSWSDAIETVSRGLRQNYIDKGATNIYQIGRIYAESKAWPYKVNYFMAKIEEFKSQNEINNLSISL